MLAEPLAIISYDKRELYAVRVKEIRLSSNRRNISIATVIL